MRPFKLSHFHRMEEKTEYIGKVDPFSFLTFFMISPEKLAESKIFHSRVNPIVFGNKRSNRTTDMGENVPPKPVFRV